MKDWQRLIVYGLALALALLAFLAAVSCTPEPERPSFSTLPPVPCIYAPPAGLEGPCPEET